MGVKATRVVAIPRSVISPSPPDGSAGNWAIRRDTTQQPNLWTAASLKKNRKSFPPSWDVGSDIFS